MNSATGGPDARVRMTRGVDRVLARCITPAQPDLDRYRPGMTISPANDAVRNPRVRATSNLQFRGAEPAALLHAAGGVAGHPSGLLGRRAQPDQL
jgi:hypothetical protein